MKKLIFIFASAFLIFSSCSNLLNESDMNNPASEQTSNNESESEEVRLKVKFDEDSSSRTALPDVSVKKFNYISLMYVNDGQDYSSGYTMVGNWESADQMRNATLPFKVGTYYFTLTAVYNEVVLEETKQYTIKKGSNSLSFTPKLTSLSFEFKGKGNVNVALRYNTDNVKKVTAGLYTTEGNRLAGYNDEPLVTESGGNVCYKKENVPGGSYIVVFKFYADDACTQLLGTYREYASIVNGLTSSSECVLDSVGSLFNINYELDGGAFADGVNRPGSYTRRMERVTLPLYTETTDANGNITSQSIYKTGYTFDGWYDNADFSGSPVTEIPSGSTGDKTFYAKWIKNVIITFSASEGSFTTSNPSQTVSTGKTVCLELANRLGINNGKKPFKGWTKTTGSSVVDYKDGAEITVNDNITLYAVWGVSEINPTDSNDIADYDKDGISDWQEIYVHHTDPASADTDGDGWTDFEELSLYNRNTNVFNPLIADVPNIEVKMVGMPSVKYNYSLSSGKSESESKSFSEGHTGSSSASSSNTSSFSETSGWSESLQVGAEWGLETKKHLNFTVTAEQSKTKGDSYTYGKSESAGWAKNWSNGKSKSSSSGKNLTDADLSVNVVFKNPGNIAYAVEDITLALYRISNNTASKKVFVKNFSIDDKKVFTLAAGTESGVYSLSAKLNLQDAENFFKFSNGFIVEISGYKITLQKANQYANDFTEALTQVRAKTASVYIDFGNESSIAPRTYNVSVKNKYNPAANNTTDLYSEVSLKDVLDNILHMQAGIDYTLTSDGGINSIYTVSNSGSSKTGGWYLSHKYTDQSGKRMGNVYVPYPTGQSTLTPDISNIKINAGDTISLVYSFDKDEDGVPLNEELIYGTDDNKKDTDDDGIEDFYEIYGWDKTKTNMNHLDAKYDGKKVCTNPVNADTDGDDLWDYKEPEKTAADANTKDTDPVVPASSGNADLAVFKYSLSKGNGWENAPARVHEGTASYDTDVDVSTDSDTIYLDVQSAKSLAKIEVETKYHDVTTPRMDPTKETSWLSTTPIPLDCGNNMIKVKCTAPDGQTAIEKYFNVSSKFPDLKNFDAVSRKFGGGEVTFTWTSYTDNRAASEKNGGYYLIGCKESRLQVDRKLAINEISTSNVDIDVSNRKNSDTFGVKVDASDLAAGRYILKDLAANTNYCFYLYAYSNSHNPNLFAYQLLASKAVKTAVTEQGTLTFYAHYVNAYEDQDGGSDPKYYWSFHESQNDNLPKWGLSSMDVACSDKLNEFDDDDDKYYCFGQKHMHKANHGPDKFSDCTKKLTKAVPRNKDYEFTVSWKVSEYDPGSADDDVGTYEAIFKYSQENDTWTIIYGPGVMYYNWMKANYQPWTKTITTGQRTDGFIWGIYNKSCGEVELHLDIGWE